MRTLIQILTLLFLMQNTGISAWADSHSDPEMPSHESAVHAMNGENHDMHNDCCDLNMAGLIDCVLECLSGCSVMSLANNTVIPSSYAQSGHPLLTPDTDYSSFSPPPETPPPLV